jgi:hypothetical protein
VVNEKADEECSGYKLVPRRDGKQSFGGSVFRTQDDETFLAYFPYFEKKN